MNGPVPGRVLVYLLSRLIGSRNGNVFFVSAAAELGSTFGRFRSTVACVFWRLRSSV